jgi:hypothetical protein
MKNIFQTPFLIGFFFLVLFFIPIQKSNAEISILGSSIMDILSGESLTVTGVDTIPEDKSVVLFWDAVKDDDGNRIAKYEVSYGKKSVSKGESPSYEKTITIEDEGALTLGIVRASIENLENERMYYFAIKAIDSTGKKSDEYSEEISSIPTSDTESSPQVEDATALTKNIVKVVFSKKIVLPEDDAEFAFEIKEKDDMEEILSIKNVVYKTNYFLNAEEDKEKLVEADQIIYIETNDDQKEGTEYVVTVSSIIVDENQKPISSASTDSAEFTGIDDTQIPESEKPADPSPTPVASTSTPTPTATATPPPPTPTATPLAPNEKIAPEGAGPPLSFLNGELTVEITKNSKEGIIRVEKNTGVPSSFVLKESTAQRKVIPVVYDISFKDNDTRTFSAKITVTPSPADIIKAGITPSELTLFYYDQKKKVWENANGESSPDGKSIFVISDHFSQWIVGSETTLHAVAEDKTPPEEITNFTFSLKASIENFLINLSWKKSIDSAGDLAVQMLYKSLDNGKTWDNGQEISKDITKFTITSEPEKEYAVKLTTKDKSGNESEGIIKTIKVPALPASGAPIFLILGSSLLFAGMLRMRRKDTKKL